MKKHLFRSLAALAIVCGLLLGMVMAADDQPKSTGSAAKHKPLNVLFIMSDDMRAECGCDGGMAKTPNIDALAAAGVNFLHGYCQFPLCNPSRSSMLTGRNPTTTGVFGNRTWFGDAHPDFVSMPKYFMQHGYASLLSGKIFHGGIDDTAAWTEGGVPRFLAGVDNPEQATPGSLPSSDPDEARPIEQLKADDAKKSDAPKPDSQKSDNQKSANGPASGKKAAAANSSGVTRAKHLIA